MRAYLIDPKLHRAHDVELPDNTRDMLAQMQQLIGCRTLGGGRISDMHDQLWCDDSVFSRGLPCFAWRLRGDGVELGPYGGICIITGADRRGNNQPPYVPLDVIKNDIDWLGEILPSVDWVDETQPGGMVVVRGIVTYKRPS
jgi:hypothetical protein